MVAHKKRKDVAAIREERLTEDRYVVPALQRGLQLLDCFSRDKPEWTLSELASALGAPVASVFRLAHTLETMGFLIRGAGNRKAYRLGRRLLNLGFEYLNSLELLEVARPFLSDLRERTGGSVQLAVREERDAVYLIRISGRMRLSPDISVGTRLPAYAVIVGRILLSELSDTELESLYEGQILPPLSARTPTSLPQLREMLRQDRARGYVLTDVVPGLTSLATGVRDGSGEIVAAISLSGTEAVIAPDQWKDLLGDVLETARGISEMLGWKPAAGTQRQRA